MSLISVDWLDGKYASVNCSKCGAWCFTEEVSVIADMALRDVVPLCWECDPGLSDTIPQHLYFLEDTFLLGIGERSFLGEWLSDDLEIKQEDLRLTKIGSGAYCALKTGNLRIVSSLSRGTNLHTIFIDIKEQGR